MCIIQNLSAIKVKYVLFFFLFYDLLAHLFNLWERIYRKLIFFLENEILCSSTNEYVMSLYDLQEDELVCLSFSSFSSTFPILQEDYFQIHCVAFSLHGLLHTEINLPHFC